jgi:release factor glutamine methyltransferase
MKTPNLSHLTKKDFENVYEPMEDTFLLLDALEEDLQALEALNPQLICEIGSGSGCVITFLSMLLGIR